jgi:hypothetical protein
MAVEQAALPDLASQTPGPELAARLEALCLADVPDAEIVEVLRATGRQIAHLQALSWSTMLEIGRRQPIADLAPAHDQHARAVQAMDSWHWATSQIAVAMTWSGRRTDVEYGLAHQLLGELPLVWAALSGGQIDGPKAKVFAAYLINLDAAQIELISRRVLPHAPRWTTAQLAHRLLREVLAIDPTYTRRRYEKAVRERGVSGYLTEDGTAVLSGHGLSPTEAAAAAERLEQLAAAVRAAGHPHTEAQLRADLFVRLLDGRYTGLTSDEIILALLADTGSGNPPDAAGTEHGSEQPRRSARRTSSASDSGPGRADESSAATTGGADTDATTEAAPAAEAGRRIGPKPATPTEGRRLGIEVRVGLATLLGLDDHPAEIPGWGPITAQDARLLVDRQVGAEWRFAVVDIEGYLTLGGLIRRRPSGRSRGPTCRGGVVEIHVRADLLKDLNDHPALLPDWTEVVAEIARRYAARDTELARLDTDRAARFPGAELRRHVQMRDRTCVAPGCRRAARRTDIDHTHDHARGGATVRANMAPLCLPHHTMKHRGGWTLTQPEPGWFRWRSPLGQLYRTRGEAIAVDLPRPVPGRRECDGPAPGAVRWEVGPIFQPGQWARLHPPRGVPKPAEPNPRPPPF